MGAQARGLLIFISFLCVSLLGCPDRTESTDATTNADHRGADDALTDGTPALRPNVVVLETAASSRATVAVDHIVLRREDIVRQAIGQGTLLIGSTPPGFVRRVVEVKEADSGIPDEVTLVTTNAALVAAFDRAVVDVDVNLASLGFTGIRTTEEASFRAGPISATVQPMQVELLNPHLLGRIRIEAGVLQEFSLYLDSSLSASSSASISLGVTGSLPRIQLGPPVSYPFAFAIGPVPVFGLFIPMISIGAEISGEAFSVQYSTMMSGSVRVGVRYADGHWSPISQGMLRPDSFAAGLGTPSISGRLFVPELAGDIQLYGIAGPYMSLFGFVEFSANPAMQMCSYRSGVGAAVGVRLNPLFDDLLGLSANFSARADLLTGPAVDCASAPDGGTERDGGSTTLPPDGGTGGPDVLDGGPTPPAGCDRRPGVTSDRPTACGAVGTGTIAGIVCARDRTNTCLPVAGAVVGYRSTSDRAALCAVTTTNAAGRYSITNVDPVDRCGEYTVMVSAPAFLPAARSFGCVLDSVRAGATTTLDLEMLSAPETQGCGDFRTGTIAGTICSRDRSNVCQPVVGATVAYRETTARAEVARGVTDRFGRYAINGVDPVDACGAYTVMVTAPGFNGTARSFGCGLDAVRAGYTNSLGMETYPAAEGTSVGDFRTGTISGIICSRDRTNVCQPIAGATVAYRLTSTRSEIARSRTDRFGRFSITGVDPVDSCGAYTVMVTAAGFNGTARSFGCVLDVVRAGYTNYLDMEMYPAAEGTSVGDFRTGTISGVVCTRDRSNVCQPVVGATISYRLTSGGSEISTATTDRNGRYSITGVEPADSCGYYTVSSRAAGYNARSRSFGCVLDVVRAGYTTQLDLELVPSV